MQRGALCDFSCGGDHSSTYIQWFIYWMTRYCWGHVLFWEHSGTLSSIHDNKWPFGVVVSSRAFKPWTKRLLLRVLRWFPIFPQDTTENYQLIIISNQFKLSNMWGVVARSPESKAHVSTIQYEHSSSNWNLALLVFRRREKFGVYPKENLSEQSREPTTNWAHVTTPNLGKEPLDRLVGGECSHHYTIPMLPREL